MRDNFLGESDFEAISHQEFSPCLTDRQMTMVNQPKSGSHEIAIGSDEPIRTSVSKGTEVMQKIHTEAACNTARVMMSDAMVDTKVTTQDMSSQAYTNVRDQGCDGIQMTMQNQASQMEVEVKDCDVTCDLLIPSDGEEGQADLEEVSCIKCNGSQVNKKGLPCRKCNGRGTLVSKELSAVAAMVR